MTLAARTREAAAEHPFLVDALRAGVVNYAAAARFLGVDGEEEAVATALRRYEEAVPDYAPEARSVRVTMQSGLDRCDPDDGVDDALLRVGESTYAPADGGRRTAIVAAGTVDGAFASAVLDRLAQAGVDVEALAFDGDALVAVVERRAGANAVRAVERASESVPDRPDGLDA
ncbi:DUF7523 family protein [Haloarchaeobius sp. HRN-SO-5]|uniref:DUF7523 family protein n=1 Tax=Haloarchaeobius sp. HRN-SO-5 TaxID=3446118 RepID=UPI003EBCE0C0